MHITNIDGLKFDRLVVFYHFHTIINGDDGYIWSSVKVELCSIHQWKDSITILCKNGLLSKHNAKERKQKSLRCSDSEKNSWVYWESRYVVGYRPIGSIFSQQSGSIKYTIANISGKALFFWFTTGCTRGALYTALFMVMN